MNVQHLEKRAGYFSMSGEQARGVETKAAQTGFVVGVIITSFVWWCFF